MLVVQNSRYLLGLRPLLAFLPSCLLVLFTMSSLSIFVLFSTILYFICFITRCKYNTPHTHTAHTHMSFPKHKHTRLHTHTVTPTQISYFHSLFPQLIPDSNFRISFPFSFPYYVSVFHFRVFQAGTILLSALLRTILFYFSGLYGRFLPGISW
jgi:hypothetical protein